ncbi:MAG TPA: hypothetical protein VF669_16305 [Tepidisphaeraceae bacterium]
MNQAVRENKWDPKRQQLNSPSQDTIEVLPALSREADTGGAGALLCAMIRTVPRCALTVIADPQFAADLIVQQRSDVKGALCPHFRKIVKTPPP